MYSPFAATQASYANDIISHLKQAEMIVVEGTLYPLLNRLKKDGWLKYEWQESTQGPPRKYYALTDEGEEALLQLDASWNELANTVNILQQRFSVAALPPGPVTAAAPADDKPSTADISPTDAAEI